jgi:hypothetical protein
MDDKRLEVVARRVCELRGLDPDKDVVVDENAGWLEWEPLWRKVSREVLAHQQISRALCDTLAAE